MSAEFSSAEALDRAAVWSHASAARPAIPRDLPRAVRFVLGLATRMQAGTLTIAAPDGRRFHFAGAHPGEDGELVIRHPRAVRRLIVGGSTGFAESYVDGDWDSRDPAALMALALRNEHHLADALAGRAWFRRLGWIAHLLRANSRRGSRRNIARHYDLGNAFYAHWLDPSMTYSGAVFEAPGETLEEAQRNKYRRLADLAGVLPGDRVLEIGCGWGAFARYLAAERGAAVTAITVSAAQHAHVARTVSEAGLADRVEVRLSDYRDTEGTFDRIVSVEMLEAVGESYWPRFFAVLGDRLRSGGAAAIQVITIDDRYFDDYRRTADFIQRHIFPGGMLPSRGVLRAEAARAGFAWDADSGHGGDYAATLALWKARFLAAWPEIAPLGFDDRFRRLWVMYLDYCRAGFAAGTIDVRQIRLRRP